METMKQIKNKIFNKTWKKCVFIFIIVFLIVLFIGGVSIGYIHHSITNSHIHADNIIVNDKIHNIDENNDYFLIEGNNNKTYIIMNDKYGSKMVELIEVGHKYKVVVQDPDPLVNSIPYYRIIQVHNATS